VLESAYIKAGEITSDDYYRELERAISI